VEHNPSAADQARANGATVFTGGIEDADFPDASFDVVTMNFSLEHLYDPRKAMSNVKRMLAPGGIVYLLFPMADGLTFRGFGPDWHHLDPPRHLQFFNRASFERLCRDTGLEIVHAGARSGTRGIRRSLGLIGERSATARILSKLSGLGPFHWALRVLVRCFVDPFGLGEIGEYLVRRAGDAAPGP
jgi:SAM-dependent methyltransferase